MGGFSCINDPWRKHSLAITISIPHGVFVSVSEFTHLLFSFSVKLQLVPSGGIARFLALYPDANNPKVPRPC